MTFLLIGLSLMFGGWYWAVMLNRRIDGKASWELKWGEWVEVHLIMLVIGIGAIFVIAAIAEKYWGMHL